MISNPSYLKQLKVFKFIEWRFLLRHPLKLEVQRIEKYFFFGNDNKRSAFVTKFMIFAFPDYLSSTYVYDLKLFLSG